MSDTVAPPPPVVRADPKEIAPGVYVIHDHRVPLVPNIGIILGTHSALVVDTGMGPVNGAAVLAAAKTLAHGRDLILTLTHFHPEHGFGAQAFKDEATIVYNRAQATELAAKGPAYLGMFRGMSADVAAALEGTELVSADQLYDGADHEIDLGGRTVVLRTWGPAHTQADQIVWLPTERILFTGDLAEERIFPIFPWFPPDDADIDAKGWLAALDAMVALAPEVVVPGHGAVGGVSIVKEVAAYIRAVATAVNAGESPDEISERMLALHPDWDAPEWIGFAVRYFQDKPL
jgi:glyoxylase-like metal-dependent hydrolase (beta-lactamase superfamily II)